MKIINRGFSIIEVCPVVDALHHDGTNLRIDESSRMHSVGMSADDVKALIEALQEAYHLMTGETPAASPSDTRTVIIDGDGDKWYPVANTDLYTYDDMKQTREWIQSTYGIREG